MDDHPLPTPEQAALVVASEMRRSVQVFLLPLLAVLDAQLDRRLVRTLLASVEAILAFRHRAHGLLLSELGAFLAGPAHAPAGTKRLSNLLRSPKWNPALIEDFLWQQAEARRAALAATGETVLAIWDESVLEKPESQATPDLCPVRSRKAGRLARSRGRKAPPSRPVLVWGLHWLGLLILGYEGSPTLACMRWWTTRGLGASDKRSEEALLLAQCAHAWGRRVLHLWDRGFAGAPWLGAALDAQVRFVLRWRKRYVLCDATGRARPAWQLLRGKRAWGTRDLWDGRRHCWRKTGVLACPVTHPSYAQPLWLVVARRGQGESPWYLLTTESVQTAAEAWGVVLAYARRWQIELTWRYSKSELAMESPRLWTWERRHKLLLLASLAYAFLLALLHPALAPLRTWLLRHWCHRTGRHCREATAPLYRLRAALARLWLAVPRAPAAPCGQPLAP
jgi:hypothetical protein